MDNLLFACMCALGNLKDMGETHRKGQLSRFKARERSFCEALVLNHCTPDPPHLLQGTEVRGMNGETDHSMAFISKIIPLHTTKATVTVGCEVCCCLARAFCGLLSPSQTHQGSIPAVNHLPNLGRYVCSQSCIRKPQPEGFSSRPTSSS